MGARWLVTRTLGSPNVTTVTPSDQAGAASAERPATIPTQRSGQALRLLVLGTGEGAAAFRTRAAEAGAELAQRFSVRVTHVVVTDDVGEEDARVVRARTAGLPVLGLAEGSQLIEAGVGVSDAGDEADAAEPGADAAAGKGDEEADGRTDLGEADAGGEALNAADGGVDAGGDDADADADADASVDDARGGLSMSGHVGVVSMVRPRAEFAPEPIDGGPSDVFTGSALEAMLQFPPLPADELETGVDVDVEVTGTATATADEVRRSALTDVSSAACACADGEAGAEAGAACGTDAGTADDARDGEARAAATAVVGRTAASAGLAATTAAAMATAVAVETGAAATTLATATTGAARSEVGSAGAAGPEAESAGKAGSAMAAAAAEPAAKAGSERGAAWTVSSIAWALVPFVSLGLLTPVAIGYAAYRLRSRSLAFGTACYSVAVVAAFAVSAVVPVRTGSHSVIGDLLTTCLAAAWLGGTVHGFLIRRRVFS